MRRVLWVLVVVAVLAGAFVPDDDGGGPVLSPVAGDGCPARDLRVPAPYAITGYWVMPRADRCVTRRMVEAVHAIGGDTLVTFGPRFAVGVEPEFGDCVIDGRPCAEVPGKVIRRVYSYTTSEAFGDGVLRCPGADRRVEIGARTYYRVLLGASCAAREQDLVLIASDGDGLGNLMSEAAAYGMRVFPGLPAAPQVAAKPWEPDLGHLDALNGFTERVLTDYQAKYGGSAAFGGIYQSFELAVRDRGDKDPIIDLYAAQHAVVTSVLPGKMILVSPYIDGRRARGFPPEQVADGMADIAGTRAGAPMAIAVQDGRGTGKVPVHRGDEAAAPVGPRLAPVVGDVRNDQGYYGPTSVYIEAAARPRLPGVELWVNVEAFEPTPVPGECGRIDPLPLRGRTSKSRLDQQIMGAGGHAVKIISYGWDPFFTCQSAPDATSLSDDIAAGWQQPIIVGASRQVRGGRPGILIEGHNLRGGTFTFAAPGERGVVVPQEWYERGRLDTAWAPYEPRAAWTSITATNAAGHSSTSAYAMPSG
ncbi:hypothetical protein HII36_42570 [Nonomuraea sp. NN258]|uniref:DUF4434 domain-containing protein n=1 Tax=Nonomuraea antri TaxID=2730852 RepID=UPI001568A61E|nr:DUF4434 domain-containing protein [Nonomuraea antri]NRQ38468.1 hypothetical protein [Nonomuraea antri]